MAGCTRLRRKSSPDQVVAETDYLHAECASAIFGFVDDLELHLRTTEGMIAVRSAARLGYSDLGVNRRRIENLRALLVSQGIVANPRDQSSERL